MAVGLGEITGIKGDASVANGGGAVDGYVADNRIALSYLDNLASTQATVNQYLLKQHDDNLQNYLKGMGGGDLAIKDVLSGDRDALMNDYVGYAKTVADSYGAIRNPLSNRAASANLMTTEAGFRNKLSQSQQDKTYITEQQKFLEQHPDFKTPENLAKIESFMNSPVGKREYFTIDPPLIADYDAHAKVAAAASKKEYATATTNGKYVRKEEGDKIDEESYNQFWKAENLGKDKYGRRILDAAQRDFNQLKSAGLDKGYKDFDDYLYQQGQLRKPQDNVKKSDLDEDQFATIAATGAQTRLTESMRESFEAGQKNKDRALKWAELDLKKEKINPEEAGLLKNQLLLTAFTPTPGIARGAGAVNNDQNLVQNVPNSVLQNIYGDNSKVTIDNQTGTKSQMPRISVIGNYVDDKGQLVIHLRDNQTGKQVNKKTVSFDKAVNDFNFIKGSDNASKLADGSQKWVKNKLGEGKPTYEKLKKALDPDSDKSYSMNGTSYTMSDLLKSYTQEEIDQAVSKGILK